MVLEQRRRSASRLGQNASFYPELDVIHIFGVKLLGLFGGGAATVGTVYFVLVYPLVAVTTYLLCRSERLGRTASVVVAVLFRRRALPRTALPALLAGGLLDRADRHVARAPCGERQDACGRTGRRSRGRLLLWVLALAIVGLSGAYYSGFTLILLAAVTVLRAGGGRPAGWWRGGLASIAGVGLVAALPLVAARIGMSGTPLTGPRPASRNPLESERYAGRIIDLVLPWEGHRLTPLADLTNLYQAAGRPVFETVALGVVGPLRSHGPPPHRLTIARDLETGSHQTASLGGPAHRGWALLHGRRSGKRRGAPRHTPATNLVTAVTVHPAPRPVGGRALAQPPSPRWVAIALPAVVLVVGVLDQTNPGTAPHYAEIRARMDGITAYTHALEDATQRPGCGVLQLPVMRFPEGNLPQGYDINAQLLQHLTTDQLAVEPWRNERYPGRGLVARPGPQRTLTGSCVNYGRPGSAPSKSTRQECPRTMRLLPRSPPPWATRWRSRPTDGSSLVARIRSPRVGGRPGPTARTGTRGVSSGGIAMNGDRVHQDVGPLTSFFTENLSTSPTGPITVSVDATALGAPEREVIVRDGEKISRSHDDLREHSYEADL